MNSAVRRFILVFFSIATLSACEDPTEIGLELQDDNQIGTAYTDTLTIKAGTVLLNDSILSFSKSPLIGFYSDPNLGTARASFYTEVGLNGADLNFGTSPVAESIALTLDYNFIYPRRKDNSPVTLKVYELTEGFQDKSSYFTNSPGLQYGALLGSVTFEPKLDTVTRAGARVDSASLIRVPLPLQLAQRIIAESGKPALSNQVSFNNLIKGLALVVDGNTQSSIVGLNIFPNTAVKTNKSALTLTYSSNGESKTHDFVFSGSRVRSFSRLVSDRSGTALAALQSKGDFISADQTGGLSYVQAGTQLLTKLTFPYLKKLKETHGELVLNRAELIVPVKQGTVIYDEKQNRFTLTEPPLQLVMYETNSRNRILKTADGIPKSVQVDLATSSLTYNYPTALTYNASKNQYTVNVTSYIQAILMDQKPNDGILLAPAKLDAVTSGFQISQDIRPYRAILEARDIKLRVYFSKLN